MEEARKKRLVARWLVLGVFMIIIQVLLGGITRLTGSGLSITEWKPIIGAIPPLNNDDWNAAFELYKQKAAGQFNYQNSGFSLQDFKMIYLWEWLHREWARLMGIIFAAGFIYFLVKKYFDRQMVNPFIMLFLLGILQGAIGWIMVQSGLNENDLHVSHIRLAIHFVTALLLLCYVLWFALKLLVPEKQILEHDSLRRFTLLLVCLLTVQLFYGAFMAGLKAAPAAATWPTINGAWLVSDMHHFGNNSYSGIHVFTDNPLVVHLIHRSLAYLLFFGIIAWGFWLLKIARREGKPLLRRNTIIVMVLVMAQVILGLYTVLASPLMTNSRFGQFEWLAQTHQLVAVLLLMGLVMNMYLVRKEVLSNK